ncbi:ABC transporter [Rubneribacter badeniensis]|uniref:ABC transporter n=1 Tax=Rubneribacter badeniensis TaxID=2070688 RepID=A0A2K2U5C8_9ACTN|nr:ABC transporter ATP-binding protein [Rubneribacter badeniensis]OUO97037.1 ABC transporter [Gordonibacter sp. An232A]PNV65526.1 ABC transporter [Rubneribacter badeniensis]CVH80088.1 Putative HMP/thiamine import ATP-binding protein YkoD [Coriobacteriaceae bacterium CHKCI002]
MSAPAIEFRDAGFSYAALDGEADGAPRGAAGASDGGSGAHARGAASVSGVNLVVRPGECVVLTGPSGCGKTTLTRMVNGLIPALYAGEATGEVLVQGVPMDAWEMDDLSCAVGSVFQNPRSQFFNLDTTSEVAFGCENMGVPQGEMHARVAATVRELSIERLMERDIRALSGGEKQLVAVASVHAMEPSVFVLDEPTAALDVDAMKRLRDVLARLKAAGKAILVAEHRLWWLAGVADRIVLMEDGRITCDLPVAEFAAMPAAERARKGLRAWDIAEVEPAAKDSEDRGGVEARTLEASCAEEPAHPLLEVRGLEARYGRRGAAVVRNCEFSAQAGRAVALVGRNGAGKTTLARCLAGLHAESAGEVRLSGRALGPRERAGRVYLAMQESGYQLFSDTAAGELRLALEARERRDGEALPEEEAAALVDRTLADFALGDFRERHPLSLSGGQRQRLAIAAGALQGARVMVLDEPTSGLDLANMRRVAAQIERLKARGTCLVIVTHDFEFACATCDELAFMADGRIAERFAFSPRTLRRAREVFGFG